MAQYATPDADIVDGTWLDEAASNVNLYDGIVPGTPGSIGAGDDATYIESVLNPSAAACAFGLSNISDPVASTGHIIRWRRGKDTAGGGQIDLTVQLRQGYVSEVTQGTQITSQADNNLSDTIATTSYTLSAGEADSITDYTDLQVRFSANQST
jgi:hypothetical protein